MRPARIFFLFNCQTPEGKKGVVQMENFTGDSKIIPFQEDKK